MWKTTSAGEKCYARVRARRRCVVGQHLPGSPAAPVTLYLLPAEFLPRRLAAHLPDGDSTPSWRPSQDRASSRLHGYGGPNHKGKWQHHRICGCNELGKNQVHQRVSEGEVRLRCIAGRTHTRTHTSRYTCTHTHNTQSRSWPQQEAEGKYVSWQGESTVLSLAPLTQNGRFIASSSA